MTKQKATYEVMRARVDAVIASEPDGAAKLAAATWSAPRCVIDEGAEGCPTCAADRAVKAAPR